LCILGGSKRGEGEEMDTALLCVRVKKREGANTQESGGARNSRVCMVEMHPLLLRLSNFFGVYFEHTLKNKFDVGLCLAYTKNCLI